VVTRAVAVALLVGCTNPSESREDAGQFDGTCSGRPPEWMTNQAVPGRTDEAGLAGWRDDSVVVVRLCRSHVAPENIPLLHTGSGRMRESYATYSSGPPDDDYTGAHMDLVYALIGDEKVSDVRLGNVGRIHFPDPVASQCPAIPSDVLPEGFELLRCGSLTQLRWHLPLGSGGLSRARMYMDAAVVTPDGPLPEEAPAVVVLTSDLRRGTINAVLAVSSNNWARSRCLRLRVLDAHAVPSLPVRATEELNSTVSPPLCLQDAIARARGAGGRG
jgi:hypothetical protein